MQKKWNSFCGRRTSFAGRIFFCLVILTAIGFLTGCEKKTLSNTTTPAPPLADTAPTSTPMPAMPQYTSAPVTIAANPAGRADLRQLNHAYINWIVQNRQRPKNFEEFVALSGIQVPPPPTGMKYVIDKNGFINLENN